MYARGTGAICRSLKLAAVAHHIGRATRPQAAKDVGQQPTERRRRIKGPRALALARAESQSQ